MRELDEIIRKLRLHFVSVIVRPCAGEEAIQEVRSRIPEVPELLISFWNYCDGIEVTRYEEGNLFSIQESLRSYPLYGDAKQLGRFVALRGDGCGDYDCLVVGNGPCEGSVVFWDHEIYEGAAYLLGGSLFGYLDMWADHMIHEYLPNGNRNPKCRPPELDEWPWLGTPEYEHPWPFDEEWMRQRDLTADQILRDRAARKWLLRQDDLQGH